MFVLLWWACIKKLKNSTLFDLWFAMATLFFWADMNCVYTLCEFILFVQQLIITLFFWRCTICASPPSDFRSSFFFHHYTVIFRRSNSDNYLHIFLYISFASSSSLFLHSPFFGRNRLGYVLLSSLQSYRHWLWQVKLFFTHQTWAGLVTSRCLLIFLFHTCAGLMVSFSRWLGKLFQCQSKAGHIIIYFDLLQPLTRERFR